jgi:hypothetical protein
MADGSTDASTGVGVAIFAAGPLKNNVSNETCKMVC